MSEFLDLAVVVPFFNEAENIAPLLAEIRRAMDAGAWSYEAIFVDDGSSDATAERLIAACATWPQARFLKLEKNSGQAAALLRGFGEVRSEWVATLDGDGQNDPADIARLWDLRDRADMIAGVRAKRDDSALRKNMSRLANSVRSKFLGDGVRDSGCAIKLFRREVVATFLPIRTLYSFMPALAAGAGFRIIECEVNHRARTRGESKYGLGVMLWRPIVDMLGVKWFLSRRIPMSASKP